MRITGTPKPAPTSGRRRLRRFAEAEVGTTLVGSPSHSQWRSVAGGLRSGSLSSARRTSASDRFEIAVRTFAWQIKQPFCGDGIRDAAEACDDGNLDDGDGCDSECGLPNAQNLSAEGSSSGGGCAVSPRPPQRWPEFVWAAVILLMFRRRRER